MNNTYKEIFIDNIGVIGRIIKTNNELEITFPTKEEIEEQRKNNIFINWWNIKSKLCIIRIYRKEVVLDWLINHEEWNAYLR